MMMTRTCSSLSICAAVATLTLVEASGPAPNSAGEITKVVYDFTRETPIAYSAWKDKTSISDTAAAIDSTGQGGLLVNFTLNTRQISNSAWPDNQRSDHCNRHA